MNNNYPFVAHRSPSQTLAEKYCSCLFKTQARQDSRRTQYNPYAICQANTFNYRGLKGSGGLPCFYERSYLQSQKYSTLAGYASNKGLVDPDEEISFDELVDIIADFLEQEERLYPESMHAVPRMLPQFSPSPTPQMSPRVSPKASPRMLPRRSMRAL